MLATYQESMEYVIENRGTWKRANAAIMAKIQENEVAREALKGPKGGLTALSAHAATELSRPDKE